MAKREDVINRDVSNGFDAGNYASAYETTEYDIAVAKLSFNRSAEYVAAFTLGFFSSYEIEEMGCEDETYLEALALVGERAVALGIDVPQEQDYDGAGEEWTRTEGAEVEL